MLVKSLGLLWLGVAYAHGHSHEGHKSGHFHHPPVRRDVAQPYIGTRLPGQIDVLAAPVLVGDTPPLPPGSPQPAPSYMKDNVNNFFGSAPDHGSMTGPVLGPVNSTLNAERYSMVLAAKVSGDDYWLSSLGSVGSMPFAPAGYLFFRNVKDFGAVGDGVTDDTAAINRAVAAFSASDHSTLRCGEKCGSTSSLGAVVYFPAGTYLISTPIVQYYYTQFVGNPTLKPVIKGAENFTGIALVDTDFYIPGGNGAEWYINQSNFYRQIRNFVFDMTGMNWTNTDNDQTYVPAGVHWQVGQATSITNCDFRMAVSTADHSATAVGIYMENGSGGMVSDLTFTGGNIGFLAGSQQFTAINLQFTSCLTAIKSIWNWGFTWKNIYVLSCYIAIDATEYSGVGNQGTGSIAVVDSHFNGVPYAITIAHTADEQPNIVLDNLLVENSASVVLISGGETILPGSTGALYFNSWVSGYRFLPDGSAGKSNGFVNPAPNKPSLLLDDSGAFFRKPKPQYVGETPVVATDHGISNDGTGDQAMAINELLSSYLGSVIFFPAGVYLVESTVHIPVGSKIIGSGWSQIMGTGSAFEDEGNPTVVVRVGQKGDQGVVEITDMLFTVKGATAGAVLMEWNVHESTQGSAAMWDSHFRVGGTNGSNLGLADCPIGGDAVNKKCMGASILMHITSDASGYFENVWAWVADHDIDSPLNALATESPAGVPLNVQTDISVYVGRGMLIESQGPTWLYGTASEHAQMYQYQLLNAANIYMGHMQTETPYYQPKPNALSPYTPGNFPSDPTYMDCSDDLCRGAWALRVLNSTDVFIYSAGFYSFFQAYDESCVFDEHCQQSLIQTNYANRLWMYNIFTKGNVEIVSPEGGLPALLFNDTTRNGFTSEIAAWLSLSTGGEDIGSVGDGSGAVYIDPSVWSEPDDGRNISCYPPCTYVLPPITLPTPTTFVYPTLVTEIGVGYEVPTSYVHLGNTITTTTYLMSTTTTTLTIPDVVTPVVSFWDVTIEPNVTSLVILPTPSIIQGAFNITWPPLVRNSTTYPGTVVPFYPPPWTPDPPSSTPTGDSTLTSTSTTSDSSGTKTTTGGGTKTTSSHDHDYPHVTHHRGPPKPKCTDRKICGGECHKGLGGLLNRAFHVCKPCWTGCGGLDSPNDFPNDPNDTPDDDDPNDDPSSSSSECSTTTYSSCSTACITASSTSSCSSTCRDIVGCDTTGTLMVGTYTLPPILAGTAETWSDADYTASDLAEDWAAASSIYRSEHSSGPITSGPSPTSGGGGTGTGTVTTITKVVIETERLTTTYPASLGVVGMAAAWRMGYRNFVVSDYDLDFYSISETKNICQVKFSTEYGAARPRPKTWSDIPQSVTFFSDLDVLSTKYTNCIYTNAAAPSPGDGGTVSCDGLTLPCYVHTGPPMGCNPDMFFGWLTSVKPLVNCPVATMTSSVYTTTTAVTETLMTTIP